MKNFIIEYYFSFYSIIFSIYIHLHIEYIYIINNNVIFFLINFLLKNTIFFYFYY